MAKRALTYDSDSDIDSDMEMWGDDITPQMPSTVNTPTQVETPKRVEPPKQNKKKKVRLLPFNTSNLPFP